MKVNNHKHKNTRFCMKAQDGKKSWLEEENSLYDERIQ